MKQITIKLLTTIFFLFNLSCCATDKNKIKSETIYTVLNLIKQREYEKTLEYFPFGITKRSKEEDIKMLDKISTILNQYELPKKRNLLYERTQGGNESSSYTTVILPIYKDGKKKSGIWKIQIEFVFRDYLGDKKLSLIYLDIDQHV